MNKLIVKGYKNICNLEAELHIVDDYNKIDISGSNIIQLYNDNIKALDINLLENSNIYIYIFNNLNNDVKITVNQSNNTNLFLNYSYLSKSDNSLKIVNNIDGNNNRSYIKVKNISVNNISKIDVVANIKKNTINNDISENINGLTNNGFIEVNPDIICDSNEVIANHATTIGKINEEELHYLMKKGLNRIDAERLIMTGFITSNMNNDIKEKINNEGGVLFE